MCWAKTTKIMGIRGPVAREPKTATHKTYPYFSMGGPRPPRADALGVVHQYEELEMDKIII